MHPFPHVYTVRADAGPDGAVQVEAGGVPALSTHAPPEFDGPPGHWSPETLLVAAVADCYVLSFRAVARAMKLEWQSLAVPVEGTLERTDTGMRFTRFVLRPQLRLAPGAAEAQARTVLDKAKRSCLVTNSLAAECVLEPQVAAA